MNKPGFLEGVFIAIVMSILVSAAITVLSGFFGAGIVLRFVTMTVALAYLLYLLIRSQQRSGRVTTVAVWLVLSMVLWLSWPPIAVYVLIHIGLVWLIRCLYYYSSLFSAVLDLGVSALSVILAAWAGMYTNSVFVVLWCFFLTQALFAFIPASMYQGRQHESVSENERFETAFRNAEAALQKIVM